MKPWYRFYPFAAPVMLALVLSAVAARPAFAAGSPPPSDTPAGVASPSSNTSSDSSPAGQLAGTHTADDSGRHSPLARQKASDLVVNGDPRWCPSGVVPHNGGGCSAGFPSITDLVLGFLPGPTSNGTIWVETGPALSGSEYIDGAGLWSTARNFSLTIQGGWNGHLGSTGLAKTNISDPYPVSYFSGNGTDYLIITGWVGNVTLRNLTFNSYPYNSVFDRHTLAVITAGSIVLDKVQVFNASNAGTGYGHGAELINTSGLGSVKVTNSQFNDNEGIGLLVASNGSITLKNVVADSNGLTGAVLDNDASPSAKPAAVSKSEFDGNKGKGLDLASAGAITLTSLTASYNADRGVDAGNTVFFGPAWHYPVTVSGVNNFNHNNFAGIEISSFGPIKVSKTTANLTGSGGDGVFLFNANAFSPQPVTLLGYLTALANQGNGLSVGTQGAVTATRLTTSGNANDGTFIQNTAAPSGVLSPVKIMGVNVFNSNGNNGLTILSNGAITLFSPTASYNIGAGAHLSNSTSLAQPGVTVVLRGTFEWNGILGLDYGLYVLSHGPIKLANISANYNTWDGASLNTKGLTSPQAVILTGHNSFNYNGLSTIEGNGLSITNDGKIALSNITASYNFSDGAYLDNYSHWNGSGFARSLVTLGGTNRFIQNLTGDGLRVNGNGAVVVSHVTANENGDNGMEIAPGVSPGQTVTIICSSASNNPHFNLRVDNASAIFLKGYVDPPPGNDTFNITPIRTPCP